MLDVTVTKTKRSLKYHIINGIISVTYFVLTYALLKHVVFEWQIFNIASPNNIFDVTFFSAVLFQFVKIEWVDRK